MLARKEELIAALREVAETGCLQASLCEAVTALEHIKALEKRVSAEDVERLGKYDENGKFIEIVDCQKAFETVVEWIVGYDRKDVILLDFKEKIEKVRETYRSPFLNNDSAFTAPFLCALTFALEQNDRSMRTVRTMFMLLFSLFCALNRSWNEEGSANYLTELYRPLLGVCTDSPERAERAMRFFESKPELMAEYIRYTLTNDGVDGRAISSFLASHGFVEQVYGTQIFRKTLDWLYGIDMLGIKDKAATSCVAQLNIRFSAPAELQNKYGLACSAPITALSFDAVLLNAVRLSNASHFYEDWAEIAKDDAALHVLAQDADICEAAEGAFIKGYKYINRTLADAEKCSPVLKLDYAFQVFPSRAAKQIALDYFQELKEAQRYSLNQWKG